MTPGQSHHIKIAVADVFDDFVDTSVFLAPANVQDLPVNTIGVFNSGAWYLDINGSMAWDGTPADLTYGFGGGLTGAVPVTGDWSGTGTTKIGVFDNGIWYLDLNGNGAWEGDPADRNCFFGVGLTGAVPVIGDWNGTGTTKIGVFLDGIWYLDLDGNGAWDGEPTDRIISFGVGLAGASPATGDWNGSGSTKVGIFADGFWYRDFDGNGAWDPAVDTISNFGTPGDIPVAGKWN